jgi:hypothetical protein
MLLMHLLPVPVVLAFIRLFLVAMMEEKPVVVVAALITLVHRELLKTVAELAFGMLEQMELPTPEAAVVAQVAPLTRAAMEPADT